MTTTESPTRATAEMSVTKAGVRLLVRSGDTAVFNDRLDGETPVVEVATATDEALSAAGWVRAGAWEQTFGGVAGVVFEANVMRTEEVRPMTKTTVILNCGHEHNYTGTEDRLPTVGTEHSCWSACDQVPTYRGRNPHIRRVARIATREG